MIFTGIKSLISGGAIAPLTLGAGAIYLLNKNRKKLTGYDTQSAYEAARDQRIADKRLDKITDRIIEDGSYLRLNNLTIGYDIPVGEKNFIDNLNVYIAGQNLFTWTSYSGYDPEVSTFLYTGLITGVDWNGGVNARNILLGVNFKF